MGTMVKRLIFLFPSNLHCLVDLQEIMIRRNPTLIPMSDLDVQDVRDMVAKQKQDLLNHQQLMLKMKKLVDNPTMSQEDQEMFEQMKEALYRSEKAKKPGPKPGQHFTLWPERGPNIDLY
ncbi:hypothetical protein CPB84DRAFT_1745864 [Gymnopilus junonius]|uniref:Uncharacterized protein n=1 Tax=Gymnopilus junonius TaxID=109634 RepID=A0A9P5NRW2_GYMJU|nr:hypothetical protein CPB84DRAFT_1745864 [Gymnopilus junonius]